MCALECQHVSAVLVAGLLGKTAGSMCTFSFNSSTDHLHPEFTITTYLTVSRMFSTACLTEVSILAPWRMLRYDVCQGALAAAGLGGKGRGAVRPVRATKQLDMTEVVALQRKQSAAATPVTPAAPVAPAVRPDTSGYNPLTLPGLWVTSTALFYLFLY
jgi:hypothetical protein